MPLKLTDKDMEDLRQAANCDHFHHTVLKDEGGRRVIKCHVCNCRITSFAPGYRPPSLTR